ncbi:XTP/dITP diphosphatase [Shouchella shacheensis]|uniref:XTP/dITP diphosphatase n=1 Tax=Shouchella shacheensis TaxID=1649580 RepID=UPI00073FAA83|nr:XTP/dITP diphosphatase [Shouchella shacheensis]
MNEVLIATKNKGKLAEFEAVFKKQELRVRSLFDFPELPEILEDGTTFHANAAKKAESLARYLHKPVIADDSGLVIDALDGAPGVYSARYAGEEKSDEANIEKVLSELEGVPMQERSARFFCVIAFSRPGKETLFAEGSCQGLIATSKTGRNGFGYDPIFYVPDLNKTMAELSQEEKNTISHRGQALASFKRKLPKGEWE